MQLLLLLHRVLLLLLWRLAVTGFPHSARLPRRPSWAPSSAPERMRVILCVSPVLPPAAPRFLWPLVIPNWKPREWLFHFSLPCALPRGVCGISSARSPRAAARRTDLLLLHCPADAAAAAFAAVCCCSCFQRCRPGSQRRGSPPCARPGGSRGRPGCEPDRSPPGRSGDGCAPRQTRHDPRLCGAFQASEKRPSAFAPRMHPPRLQQLPGRAQHECHGM